MRFLILSITLIFSVVSCIKHQVTAAPLQCKTYVNGKYYQCSFGRFGVSAHKKEGDGATPIGDFPLREVYFRPDQVSLGQMATQLTVKPMTQVDGWCNDPHSPHYNQHVQLPSSYSHENLWHLTDHVYDIVAVVGYNDEPVVMGHGSAIFVHVAREGYKPTAGCLAFSRNDLLVILKQLGPHARVQIQRNGSVFFYNPKT